MSRGRLSLPAKILLLALFNVLLIAASFAGFARVQFRSDFGTLLRSPSDDRILALARLIALDLQETDLADREPLLARYSAEYNVDFYLFESASTQVGGQPVRLPDSFPEALFLPAGERRAENPAAVRIPGPFISRATSSNPTRYWVGVRIPLRRAGTFGAPRGVLVISSESIFGSGLFFNVRPWIVVVVGVVLISVLCWVPFVRGVTRSVSQIRNAAGRIAEGQFDVVVPEDRADELGQLSSEVNRMARQLSSFVRGQKRFLGDIAHELCSPIARVQFALGILDHRAGDAQRVYVQDVQSEVSHMSELVNDLLSFSKAGLVGPGPSLARVDVAEIVQRVIEREVRQGAGVDVSVSPGLTALADPDYLTRALANVVRNAVRYAGPAGPIMITATRDESPDRPVSIVVADSGPGLPEPLLEEVFKPFFRPEEARNRETGGAGLGLAIVKTCVEACNGRVACRNRKPSGLAVEIRLDSADVAAGQGVPPSITVH